jgi:hypothetical protein
MHDHDYRCQQLRNRPFISYFPDASEKPHFIFQEYKYFIESLDCAIKHQAQCTEAIAMPPPMLQSIDRVGCGCMIDRLIAPVPATSDCQVRAGCRQSIHDRPADRPHSPLPAIATGLGGS